MRVHHLVSSTTPASLLNWLEEELENRGIDGVYTRYILSLLQNDSLNTPASQIECAHFETNNKYGLSSGLALSKSRHRRWKSWDNERPGNLKGSATTKKGTRICSNNPLGGYCNCNDMEECKKSAAIECLKSASEQKNGIEKLIDEVCVQLKNYKADCESPKCLSLPAESGVLIRSLTLSEPFPPDKRMEMYYSAFPALSAREFVSHHHEHRLLDQNQPEDEDGDQDDLASHKGKAWKLKEEVSSDDPESNNESDKDGEDGAFPHVFCCEIESPRIRLDKWSGGSMIGDDSSKKSLSSGSIGGGGGGVSDVNNQPQPTFIVPKMAAHHKAPNVTMFAPFTSATCQLNISKVVVPDDKEQVKGDSHHHKLLQDPHQRDDGVGVEEEVEEDWNGSSNASLPASGKTSPVNNSQDLFLVTDLASKFNSALAAIWGPEGAGDSRGESGLELSFKIYSLPADLSKVDVLIEEEPEKSSTELDSFQEEEVELPNGNINFFIGSSETGSVWSTNLEDMRALAGQEGTSLGMLQYGGSGGGEGVAEEDMAAAVSPAISDLLQCLTLQSVDRGDENRYSICCSDDFENASVGGSECLPMSSDTFSLGFGEPFLEELLKDDYFHHNNKSDSDDDDDGANDDDSQEHLDGALCLSPEMFFRETENDILLSSTEGTELDYAAVASQPTIEPPSIAISASAAAMTTAAVLLGASSALAPPAVYNLWNSPPSPQPPPLPIAAIGARNSCSSNRLTLLNSGNDSVWPASDPTEKVAQWISQQFEGGGQTAWDNGHFGATASISKETFPVVEAPISKDNCTIKFHKGESRFVEVLPSSKPVDHNISSPVSFISPGLLMADEPSSLSDDDEEEEEENLLTSHKTHFTPIRQESSETESSICDYDAVAVALEQSTTTFMKSKSKDEIASCEELEDFTKSSPCSAILEEMLLLSAPLSFEDLERSKSPDTSSEVLKTIQSGWRTSLYRDKSTSTSQVELMGMGGNHHGGGGVSASHSHGGVKILETIVEPVNAHEYNDLEDPMGFSSFRKMKIWSSDSMEELELATEVALPPHQIPWKWSTTDDTDENEEHNADVAWRLDHAVTSESSSQDDIILGFRKSVTPTLNTKPPEQECNLDALRRELEAEEEQLFRDINLASDTEDYGCAALSCLDPLAPSSNDPDDETTYCAKDLFTFGCCDDSKWSSGESEFSLKTDSAALSNEFSDVNSSDNALPSIPTEKILYSSQLEEEWHKSSQPFNIQVPRKSRAKSRSSPQRRPCSFYLEGNCRRSDCKFSHDLSTITCRFWEEGSCFKGITCPFLHGYLSEEALRQKFGSKCKFALESEADFPSLSNSSSQSTPLATPKDTKSVHKEVFAGRILRPKKKKLLAVPIGTAAAATKTLNSLLTELPQQAISADLEIDNSLKTSTPTDKEPTELPPDTETPPPPPPAEESPP